MKKLLRLYPRYLAMSFKAKMMYRADWIVGLLGFLITNSFSFLALFLSTLPIGNSIGGWSFAHIMFLYGFLLVPMGVDHALSDKLWNWSMGLINQGQLDRILMKPLNPLFQMCAEFFQEGGLAEVLLGTVVMIFSGIGLNLNMSFSVVFPIIIGALFSPLIYFSIKVFFTSFAFYLRRSISLMSCVYNLKDYGKYPLNIYSQKGTGFLGKIIYNTLIFIVPFGLIGYLPLTAQMFPDKNIELLWFSIPPNNWLIMGLIISVSLIMFFISYLIFSKSIKHYSSSGS